MKRFFKINRKKSPKPPQPPTHPTKPADINARPPDSRTELDVIPDGGRNPSHESLEADRTDQTVPPDEGGKEGSQVLVQDGVDGVRELRPTGASTSRVVPIGGTTSGGNQPEIECPDNAGGEMEPAETSTIAEECRKGTPLGVAKSDAKKFAPLKVVLGSIPARCANRMETAAVENRVANLLSRITALEERFDTPPGSVAEQRRRNELILKLNVIEEQLRLSDGQELPLPTDHAQTSGYPSQLLEALQEAILDYQMAQRMATDDQGFGPVDPVDAAVLNNVWSARQAGYQHGNRNGCLRGTRTPILDEIELWTRDFDKPPVYWLNGLAGTGKSTIAQTIAERMFADGQLGASFFCSRDFEDRRNLQYIFPTLAVQLARRYTQFRSTFIQLIQSDPEIVHESLYNQMKKLIIRPLTKSTLSTVIVIDALDECKDEEPASAILSILGQFVAEVPAVKFFITGRPESRIREGFRLPLLAEASDVFVLHEVEPDQVNNDIRLFFRHSFAEIKRYRRGLGDWPTEEQVDLLCERAGGLFVHAVATVRFVDHRNNSPKKQLDRLLQSQGSSVFEGKTKLKADATIDSLYTSILQEAFGGDDPENDPRVRSVLGAVVLAANPLSPSAIATLLGFEPEEVYPVLSSAHSLLILQEDIYQPVRPFHKSFPDFVVDPARCTDQRFRVFPPDQHTELLAGCLAVMNRELERNMCQLPDGVINSEVPDLKEKAKEHIGEALEYACRSWHKHLVGTIPAHVVPILQEFLEKKFIFWLEVLSVLGAAREAVDVLEAIAECEWPDAPATLDVVRDYIRFVILFFDVINVSAPHIYHSALPLSPQTSIIREMYKRHASPFVKVVRGIPVSWEPSTATANIDYNPSAFAWSPCNRFIAVVKTRSVEVLDAVTLSNLGTFECSSQLYGLPCFSPDSHSLVQFASDGLISWDLQTGAPARGVIPCGTPNLFSLTYSNDGKVIAAVYKRLLSDGDNIRIENSFYTYDLLAGTRVGPRHAPEGEVIYPIWTHDEHFRVATVDADSIRIWQSPFTLKHPPVEVESLPVPGKIVYAFYCLFLPSLSRLAFNLYDSIQIWDAKASKLLLKSGFMQVSSTIAGPPNSSFSSDGRFFASANLAGEVHVWKETPTGYVSHQRLPFFTHLSQPQFSPNGESIIVSFPSMLRRWRTRDQVLSLSGISAGDWQPFVLGFSPDKKFAVFARYYRSIVTIVDLHSGEQRWTTDMGVKIDCLGMTEDTVVVVGEEKIATWNLGGGDCVFHISINDSVPFTTPEGLLLPGIPGMPTQMSISPDLSHVVVARESRGPSSSSLEVDNVSTGRRLARIKTTDAMTPFFTQDGREVWVGITDGSFGEQSKIIEDSKSGTIELNTQTNEGPPRAIFRESPHGHEVTEDGWVLSPARKRLLWLPHRWRSHKWNRVWRGRFLGLLHDRQEVVILGFFE